MPQVTIKAGECEQEMQFQFWGDEFHKHLLRAVVTLRSLRSNHISIRSGDSRLIPVEAQFYAALPLKPTPFQLDIPAESYHQHPRLLINRDELAELRQGRSAQRSVSLQRIRELIPTWDRSLVVTQESKLPAGDESLAPEDRVLIGAFLALLEPTTENIDRGVKSLLEYCALTEQPGFSPLTIDTQTGETLFLMCVGYDWLFHSLRPEEEQLIRNRLWEIATICWGHLGYERSDYAQAHYLGCGMGLLAFSLLFRDTHPRGHEWSNHLTGVAKLVLSTLPDDGYFPHGINLWIYEFGFLLRWLELLRSCGGPSIWPSSRMLTNASAFRFAATSPDGLNGITFGDPQYRTGGDAWCHYLIAARTGSGQARWLGDFLRDLPVAGVDFRSAPSRRRVYEYIWFPEAVEPAIPSEQIQVFPDGGQVFARKDDTLFTFRSGPPLGRHRSQTGITGGYGHSDPCNGSFLVHHKGSFLVAGPGPVYRRDTSLQNVITINGEGHLGDSTVWMPDFIPDSHHSPAPDIRTSGGNLTATVDLAPAYLSHLGVKSLRRSIFVDAGEYILGVDVVALARPAEIEWNLHSRRDFTQTGDGGVLSFTMGAGADSPTVLITSTSEKLTWTTGLSDFVPAYPNSGDRDQFLRVACRSDNAMILWCICLTDRLPEMQIQQRTRASWIFPGGAAAEFDGMWITRRGPG